MAITIRRIMKGVSVLTLFTACLFGQTVSSGLQGSVLDPANAVVAGAPVTLTATDTAATRAAVTDSSGVFRFLNLAPGEYSLTIKAAGFKGFTQNNIVIAANETRDAGKLVLAIGSMSDTVTVTAEAASIQLASSEKSTAIDGNQLLSLA